MTSQIMLAGLYCKRFIDSFVLKQTSELKSLAKKCAEQVSEIKSSKALVSLPWCFSLSVGI